MNRFRTFLALLAALALALTALAVGASAHVTVSAPGAQRGGGDQEITFRVPVEKDVDTIGLTVALPTDEPIASVDVAPVAGWTHTQKSATLAKPIVTDDGNITTAVSQITWTAQKGRGLAPGEFGAFTILAGQLPDTSSITFRALQTYADGSVVRWNEVAAPGAKDEPDNPAPVLKLAAASSEDSDTNGDASMPGMTSSASSGDNTLPIALAAAALAVALVALSVVVLRRRRTG